MNYFSKKIIFGEKWTILNPILGSKMAHAHNSGSAVRIFSKFCTMKEANRYMEIILMAFPKKSCFRQMDHLGPKMTHPHNSGSAIRIVLQFHKKEGANRDMEIILTFFQRKKILFWAIW